MEPLARRHPVWRGPAAIGWLLMSAARALTAPIGDPTSIQPGAWLDVCPHCRESCVCPTACEKRGDRWWMRLRCGACGTSREVLATNPDAEAYDQLLQHQAAMIERAIAQLDQERMSTQAADFVAALNDGRIDASSFAA